MINKPTVALLSHTQIANPDTFLPAFKEWVNAHPEFVDVRDRDAQVLNKESYDLFTTAEGGTDPEKVIEFAGRACYQAFHRPHPKTASIPGYIENIIAQGHESVLEHSSATFYIEGVSRNVTHELIRHRHLNYSELSQRFVDVADTEFVLPPALQEYLDDNYLDDLNSLNSNVRNVYKHLVETLSDENNSPRLKRKQAREAARSIMPGNTETKIVVSGNFRAWRDVLKKRLDPAADAEIRIMCEHILVGLLAVAPSVFTDIYEEFYG